MLMHCALLLSQYVVLLVKLCPAGETRFAGQTRFQLLAKRVLPGQTQTAGRTRITARTRIVGPDADYRPNAHCRPQRGLPTGRELPPERNLLARTQFAGTKNKVTEFFSFGASDHDGVFSFPAALGGAEACLFRWLPVTRTLLDVQVIITRSSHSKGFGLDRAEPAR